MTTTPSMRRQDWTGVLPAITTPWRNDDTIDLDLFARHATWMVGHGCSGLVTPGSLGEGGLLSMDERKALWKAAVGAVGAQVPVVAAVGACSTLHATQIARAAEECGCRGLMVLPPYAYKGTWREMHAHFGAVLKATQLSCMLYNNPIAYGTDLLPAQMAQLAQEHTNVQAIKESSADIRRMTELRASLPSQVVLLVGIDDMLLEGVAAGAEGWVAGLVNGFPAESVRLLDLAVNGRLDEAQELYEWFLPLLRLDAVPEFVHLVKLAQARAGWGNERVRLPRLPLEGAARARAMSIIDACMKVRPAIAH